MHDPLLLHIITLQILNWWKVTIKINSLLKKSAVLGIYRQRHPERTVFYRVLFHHVEKFLSEYENCFEREHGFLRPGVQEVVDKYLDCGNPKCGFARIRCSDCGSERLVMLSCKSREFCPYQLNDSAHSISDALIRLASLPRVRIVHLPTPIEEMPKDLEYGFESKWGLTYIDLELKL